MLNNVITLANGTTYQVEWFGDADSVLWISGLSLSILEAATVFSASENTNHIEGSYDKVYDGYTTLINISDNRDGKIKVALLKEM